MNRSTSRGRGSLDRLRPLQEPVGQDVDLLDDPDPLVGHSTRRRIRHALWPPRPMEFESPVRTSAVRATFGT